MIDFELVAKGDIVRIIPMDGSNYTGTIAKVLDTSEDGVLVFRDIGNHWVEYKDHIITVLEST